MREQFSRTIKLVGRDGLKRLAGAHVVLIGLGAVGSYALEALARAGVGRLRLVDFDTVHPSNINRQLLALHSTLNQPKTVLARNRVLDINPECMVECHSVFVHRDTLDTVLADSPDVVIDAIESLSPKVELLLGLIQRQIPVITSMGAAMRMDPTCVRIGSLAKVRGCPLASQIRKRMRRRGVEPEVTCVYSIELPVPSAQLIDDGADAVESHADGRGRIRIPLGSFPTVTGAFGLAAASAALKLLLAHERGCLCPPGAPAT
jgi:tRNA A37 threonylcarbamoyladenosine dehydratase